MEKYKSPMDTITSLNSLKKQAKRLAGSPRVDPKIESFLNSIPINFEKQDNDMDCLEVKGDEEANAEATDDVFSMEMIYPTLSNESPNHLDFDQISRMEFNGSNTNDHMGGRIYNQNLDFLNFEELEDHSNFPPKESPEKTGSFPINHQNKTLNNDLFYSESRDPFDLPEGGLNLYTCGPCEEDTSSCLGPSEEGGPKTTSFFLPLVSPPPIPATDSQVEQVPPSPSPCIINLNVSQRVGHYPIWINEQNSCWVDAALCLLVFNQSLAAMLREEPSPEVDESCVKSLVRDYHHQVFSDLPLQSRAPLDVARKAIFQFLLKKLKSIEGHEESVLIALQQLLKENKSLEKFFKINYWWEFACSYCRYKKKDCHNVIIPSIVETDANFTVSNGYAFVKCDRCKSSKKSKKFMRFKSLPKTFCLHFLHGIHQEDISLLDFEWEKVPYRVTGIILYKQNPNHFLTYSRHRNGWLYCDDLNASGYTIFMHQLPKINPGEVHIVLWEQSVSQKEESGALDKVSESVPASIPSPTGSLASSSKKSPPSSLSSGIFDCSSASTSLSSAHQVRPRLSKKRLRKAFESNLLSSSEPVYTPYVLDKQLHRPPQPPPQ